MGSPPEVLHHPGPLEALPLVLWDWRRQHRDGTPLRLEVAMDVAEDGKVDAAAPASTDVGVSAPLVVRDLLAGAGLGQIRVGTAATGISASAVRVFGLADTVAAGMRLLVCGLNPSLLSAELGIPFARPGNRFWPALVDAGLTDVVRDPHHLLVRYGIGMTDIVKRPTARAAELDPEEYRAGMARLGRLVAWLRPGAVCFVGLAGWRAAMNATAGPGWQAEPVGGRPAYVMPHTSGLNARTPRAVLAEHLAIAGAARQT
jgi:TDG/mug DNA glycosylase family protein